MIKTYKLFAFLACYCCISIAFSQSQKNAYTTDLNTVNRNTSKSDSIIAANWKPYTVADSLLFDGNKRYFLTNSKLSFIPPKTFRDDNHGNIVHDWTGASIQLKIVNTNYELLVKSTQKQTFEKQGYTYINQQTLKTNAGKESTLYLISYKTNNYNYERIVFFIGNGDKTAWISANYPVIMKSLLYEVIEKSLLTVEF
jgi:hypothetical protein